jgi:Galactose oxidase, central domain
MQRAAACLRTSDGLLTQVTVWIEPALHGDMPIPRKGAAVASTEGTVIMFGGMCIGAEDAPLLLDELVIFGLQSGGRTFTCTVNPATRGTRPAPRMGASMWEWVPGQVLMYGGSGADGKPLNDAHVLDVTSMSWRRVYHGSTDLVGPQGALCIACKRSSSTSMARRLTGSTGGCTRLLTLPLLKRSPAATVRCIAVPSGQSTGADRRRAWLCEAGRNLIN